MLQSVIAISLGAALGAIARWLLGCAFNNLFPAIPLGTLVANLVGGYLIGLSLAFFTQYTGLSPAWKLFVITGFLGGLTTFSAEVTQLLQHGQMLMAIVAIGLHVGGSLIATLAGLASWRLLAHMG
ncbi:MAG: fluoride ion transporter CrcB [Candidatus Dactylopiibacterium carminicum]|uniref:Fluoride-specific ion channel FluC n=1 Tax=Candidatus Dactylopiibacterium carminicum TaxID=857335 RepID=A0A272EWK2_9RHOO|nr:fluoride efflux transporter CrcB [Candidatus Dactylopiibacterium carminicum]KAF7600120.1 fluoride efflux transporter CrcB [Candidatus Dactylopiibacterium carminicum]PAS94050.1 MAG: fluoride ion transporter CrcB [Candidatus Dactylopiibacterium carminicum]PAS98186.1 MAG: fluoride ion transporter CrcB [Candidatus Dactylopiibacterium carminicum]PAT00118.1 MAG: fluoride ion transporter CrcB [Candidatus Dactylopiibacterium carminicum]